MIPGRGLPFLWVAVCQVGQRGCVLPVLPVPPSVSAIVSSSSCHPNLRVLLGASLRLSLSLVPSISCSSSSAAACSVGSASGDWRLLRPPAPDDEGGHRPALEPEGRDALAVHVADAREAVLGQEAGELGLGGGRAELVAGDDLWCQRSAPPPFPCSSPPLCLSRSIMFPPSQGKDYSLPGPSRRRARSSAPPLRGTRPRCPPRRRRA